jgi:hypothetical protein
MNVQEIDINKIKPYEKNAKKHDQTQINNVAESIKQFGFVQPLVLTDDNVIVIGHCRLLAAKKLKMKTVPCVYVSELSDEEVRKLRNLDNKLNESEWDFEMLKGDIFDLNFDGFDVDWGIEDVKPTETGEVVQDEPPEVDETGEPMCKLGDMWSWGYEEYFFIAERQADRGVYLG